MAQYELILVVQPEMEEEPLKALVEKVSQTIRDLGGQVVQVDTWGRRRMAYSIKKHRDGFYFLVQMEMPTSAVRNLERSLKLVEDLMRYLVVRKDEIAA
jgi:small subunit ribosomal protein S6